MIKNYVLTIFTILLLASCGKSSDEIELEKAKIELEKTKLEIAAKQQNSELSKIHENKVNIGKRKKITELNMLLQKVTQASTNAEKNIDEVSEFQLGRLSSTREEQLKDAANELEDIRRYQKKIVNEIAQLEHHETFDFQKNPVDVMEYIFNSTKRGEFSNFRNLCDPYGENDADVNQICYAEMLLENQQAQLRDEFSKGRVMGKPQIMGDRAEVEFAFGPNGDQLEKMIMINRNGSWYLYGF